MTFKDIQDGEIERKDKRTRTVGTIVQDIRRIVTTSEIGKATVTKIDTKTCDEATQGVIRHMEEQQLSNEK